ncbi:hypothetical protein H2201_007860 [Coniosporium apollinis]|uniref:Major facilitator superfamily (MFS) profile domain-containing protein n=2 Tax=Coniosporium TaxID=2810619 RepID=A0ABQ9NII3_9PEZI|nr:hypothetical protein H2201_007860 [Coniosporium apollinis]
MAKDDFITVKVTEIDPSTAASSVYNESLSRDDTSCPQYQSSDEESGKVERSSLGSSETETKADPNIVTWDGPEDPANPKNWSRQRKWVVTIIVSAFAFISPLSSSMIAPALGRLGNELHIPSGVQLQMILSIFVLAYSFGPFFLSPASEIWGRTRIIKYSNLVFILFNVLCGFARTQGELLAFRFIAGLGGSATLGMGAGILSDCWSPEERGRGMALYQLAPILGPAIGPVAGGFIAENTTWRWSFWSITCFNIAIQLVGLFFLRETYAPRLLALKARTLRQKTGNPELRAATETTDRTLPALLQVSLTRPWRMLATQPIIQLLALYQAYNFGMLYLFISSFPALWEGRYGMSTSLGSLNYFSLALGSLIGAQICGPLADRIHRRMRIRYGGAENAKAVPEFRIPLMIPAASVTPCGIFLYGWAAQARLHWIVPNIGAALFAGGSMISYQCIQVYLVDTYTRYSASASAASAFLRSLAAFGFPLFAPSLFETLGYGWGCSALGLVAVVLGIPAPFLFWTFGARIRARSPFAAGG